MSPRRIRPALSSTLLVALLVLLPAQFAAAGTLTAPSVLLPGGGFFPPNAGGGTVSTDGPVPYTGFTFWVDQRGLYLLSSEAVFDPIPGRALLYRGPLDPERPLRNLIAVADYGDEGDGIAAEVLLEAGVIYSLVTTVSESGDYGFTNVVAEVSGPGNPERSWCAAPGDQTEIEDSGDALALQEEMYCASVTWRDHQDNEGVGTVVPYRSDDSGLFWFFNPDNWEMLVKVLDGCPVNNHYWVFFAATTDVEFDLTVAPRFGGLEEARVYHNDLATAADAVTDTAAFPCAVPAGG